MQNTAPSPHDKNYNEAAARYAFARLKEIQDQDEASAAQRVAAEKALHKQSKILQDWHAADAEVSKPFHNDTHNYPLWRRIGWLDGQSSSPEKDLMVIKHKDGGSVQVTSNLVSFHDQAKSDNKAIETGVLHAKGSWNAAMNIDGGDEKFKATAWAYAQIHGVKVSNYAPTTKAELEIANKVIAQHREEQMHARRQAGVEVDTGASPRAATGGQPSQDWENFVNGAANGARRRQQQAADPASTNGEGVTPQNRTALRLLSGPTIAADAETNAKSGIKLLPGPVTANEGEANKINGVRLLPGPQDNASVVTGQKQRARPGHAEVLPKSEEERSRIIMVDPKGFAAVVDNSGKIPQRGSTIVVDPQGYAAVVKPSDMSQGVGRTDPGVIVVDSAGNADVSGRNSNVVASTAATRRRTPAALPLTV